MTVHEFEPQLKAGERITFLMGMVVDHHRNSFSSLSLTSFLSSALIYEGEKRFKTVSLRKEKGEETRREEMQRRV